MFSYYIIVIRLSDASFLVSTLCLFRKNFVVKDVLVLLLLICLYVFIVWYTKCFKGVGAVGIYFVHKWLTMMIKIARKSDNKSKKNQEKPT